MSLLLIIQKLEIISMWKITWTRMHSSRMLRWSPLDVGTGVYLPWVLYLPGGVPGIHTHQPTPGKDLGLGIHPIHLWKHYLPATSLASGNKWHYMQCLLCFRANSRRLQDSSVSVYRCDRLWELCVQSPGWGCARRLRLGILLQTTSTATGRS